MSETGFGTDWSATDNVSAANYFITNTRLVGISLNTVEEHMFGQMSFKFNQINNWTEIGNALFDYYKLNMVKIYLQWSPEVAQGAANAAQTTSSFPVFNYYLDYSGDTVSDSSSFRDRQGGRSIRLNPYKTQKIMFRPKAMFTLGGTSTSMIAPNKRLRLDATSADYPFRGINFWIQKNNLAMGRISVKVKYYVTLYGVK